PRIEVVDVLHRGRQGRRRGRAGHFGLVGLAAKPVRLAQVHAGGAVELGQHRLDLVDAAGAADWLPEDGVGEARVGARRGLAGVRGRRGPGVGFGERFGVRVLVGDGRCFVGAHLAPVAVDALACAQAVKVYVVHHGLPRGTYYALWEP